MKHYIANIILSVMVCLAGTSCSDSESDSGHGKSPQPQALTDSVNYDRYVQVVSQLFDYDALDTANVDFQPKHGEVLDLTTPSVYSIGFKSEAEARRWFLEHCVPAEEADSINSLRQDNMALDFGKYGTLKYEKGNSSSCYATIYLNFPAVKSQNQIELIPMDRWPHNESSPFYVGDLVQRADNKQFFICVRACEGGRKGILISFSDYWNKDSFCVKKYGSDGAKAIVGADREAWDALAQFYYTNPTFFKEYFKEVEKKFPGFQMLSSSAISCLVYDKNSDGRYPYRHYAYTNWSWWVVEQTWVYVGKNRLEMVDGMPRFHTDMQQIAGLFKKLDPHYWGTSHSEEFVSGLQTYSFYAKAFDPIDSEAYK